MFPTAILVTCAVAQDKFTGVLLDAPCASAIGVKTANVPAAAELRASGDVRDVPRYTRGDLVPCQATVTSTAFSILTPAGKILQFDSRTNGKLLQQIEADQHWKDALNSVTGSPHDSINPAESNIKPPDVSDADRRTAGKDVTGSGATTTAGTSRQVEISGRLENGLLRGDIIRLAPNVKAN